jgi:hypothetical protein
MVFSLNDDGYTYSSHESKKQWPKNLHQKYMYDTLIKAGFITVENEASLYLYNEPREEYYKKQVPKYDGHGD